MSSLNSSDYNHRMERRDSASSNGKRCHRPRLLRAAATEPSLTASTASRGALAAPSHSSSRRATDLLNHIAYVGGTSPPSAQSPLMYDGAVAASAARSAALCCSSPTGQAAEVGNYYSRPHASERYFSFPRFDTWEGNDDNKDDEKSGD